MVVGEMKQSAVIADALRTGCLTVSLALTMVSPALAQAVRMPEETNANFSVQLSISARSAKFYTGEVIPLDLAFSSTTPKRYQINNARYDRSGRMHYEEFIVEPKEATRDPLLLYFNSRSGFIGGGLTSYDFLKSSPTIIHLNLNEWVSLEHTGIYRISVVSHRISDISAGEPMGEPVEVKSNWIELEIVSPDPACQALQLARIREVLNREPVANQNAPDELRHAALTELRYLGTEEAARELATRLRGNDNNTDFECMLGLVGSPHRGAGLEEMNQLFKNPDFPVTDLFLITMSLLPLNSSESPEALQSKIETNRKILNERLMNVLVHKRGKALAISLDAALSTLDTETSEDSQKQLIPELIGAFSLLSADQQITWLQNRWDAIKDRKWLPLLRTLALQYKDYPELRVMDAYQALQVTGAALTRWYELDPEGARDAVIEEIIRPKPRYNASVLGILPDKTLPDTEFQLARHFLATDNYEIEGNIASLLFRYADSDVWPEVAAKVSEKVGKWACEPQDTMLAYALRVDPQSAAPLIERAIAARDAESNGCRRELFQGIGELQTDPVLEELATRSLTDPDPQVAQTAATYLGSHGSANAEQPLWDRYEAWSKEWTGRGKELRFVYAGENPNVWQEGLGENLAHALASGLGWLSDDGKLHRIEALSVTPNILKSVEEARKAWSERPLTIRCTPTGFSPSPYSFTVAQYDLRSIEALKTKLAQFPHGTNFRWDSSNCGSSAEIENIVKEISQFATENGIQLQRAPAASNSVN